MSIQKRLFRDAFEMLRVKSPHSETSNGTHKTETFRIPKVLRFKISKKGAIFDCLYTKGNKFDALPVDDEDNIEDEVSEVTTKKINYYRNECMRETEDDLKRKLVQNHREFNKRCS